MPSLVPGHCEGLLVTWALNPAGDAVTMYRVNYGTAPGVVDAAIARRQLEVFDANDTYLHGGLFDGNRLPSSKER